MPKGKPINGFRKLHQRWTKDSLQPLWDRWMRGDLLSEIAKEHKTSAGRLRQAFYYYGFGDRGNLNFIPKPPIPRKPRGTSDYDSNHVVSESWKPKRNFDPVRHREARHYKGTFDL